MLLKLAILLSAICAISSEVVEIDCFVYKEYCRVTELPEDLPSDATWKFLCPQNCTQIQMKNVGFTRFPREIWTTHQEVTSLELDGTDFEELAFGDFLNAAELTFFRLQTNKKVLSLRDNCFWGAFKLYTLYLNGFNINEVEGGAFNGLLLLEELQIMNTNISHISNDHYRNLANLRYLYLAYNALETIESEAFLHNTNLSYINIMFNKVTELNLLLPFINPGEIFFNGNQLTKFAYRSISQEISESYQGANLQMQANALTELYIQPNFAVEQLYLFQNRIERIDTLPVLRSLKLLNLQRCAIKSLDGQRFADKYVNLETLHMTGNNMASFSKEVFSGLDKLDELWLNINELAEVDFPRLESLTTLNLKDNRLTEFLYGEDIRETFPALKDLDISNNDFEEEYLAELVKTLEDQGIMVSWENT